MDLRYLETFYWVGTLKNFGSAAAKMQIAPATAGNRVEKLESDLGVTLLDHQAQRVTLTSAGARLLEAAPGMLKLEGPDRAHRSARA